MNSTQVKIFLLKRGLTVGGMAKELCRKGQSESALRVCISQLINGHRFYPALAKELRQRYGLRLTRSNDSSIRSKAA